MDPEEPCGYSIREITVLEDLGNSRLLPLGVHTKEEKNMEEPFKVTEETVFEEVGPPRAEEQQRVKERRTLKDFQEVCVDDDEFLQPVLEKELTENEEKQRVEEKLPQTDFQEVWIDDDEVLQDHEQTDLEEDFLETNEEKPRVKKECSQSGFQEICATNDKISKDDQQKILRTLKARRKKVNSGTDEPFVWGPSNSWNGKREKFRQKRKVGPRVRFRSGYDAMNAIWHDIIPHIVTETNRYAQLLATERPRFAKDWVDTNIHEIWILFAFWIMLGVIKMPTIKSCFSKHPILQTKIFQQLFTQNRYWNLNAAFKLAEGNNPHNPLHPLGPIVEHLNERFRKLYRLDQEICIDEMSLTMWRGPILFKKYLKLMRVRPGIKTFQVCESASGYIWSFVIYVGRDKSAPLAIRSNTSAVLKLVRPLLNLGHTLYLDRRLNSPTLARWLKNRKTDCVGTVRINSKHMPLQLRCPLSEGQFIARASKEVLVLAFKQRNQVTCCLSTYHDVSQTEKQKKAVEYKFKLVDAYNHGKGGVYRMYQMLESCLMERKQCSQWSIKFFQRMLNISIQNSRIMLEKITNQKINTLEFRLALVEEIMSKHLSHVPVIRTRALGPTFVEHHSRWPSNRLTDRHFIRRTPITDQMRQTVKHEKNLGRRQCVWCKDKENKRTKTLYECAECQLPLCNPDCFREFHTVP